MQPSKSPIPQQVCYWGRRLLFFPFFLIFSKPQSLEPVNGNKPVPEDEEETFSDDTTGTNDIFPPRDGRSVSSTLHDAHGLMLHQLFLPPNFLRLL